MKRSESRSTCLSVRRLKTYFYTDEGVVKAVEEVDFDLQVGRTLGIVGESGCGKSVTARSILRIVERKGRIVEGKILLRRPDDPSRPIDLVNLDEDGPMMRSIRGREISYVFQEPMTSFSPVHTIGSQLIEVLRLHRPRLNAREAADISATLLADVDVPRPREILGQYGFQLSGGLRQRAMIAMALACDPCILIADEPTTALDVTTQAQILDLLDTLQRKNGMAIALITHNLGVVAELADDVIVMYLGQVVERGSVDYVFYRPLHPYTKALLRSVPDLGSAGRCQLPTIEGFIPNPYDRPGGCCFHPRCPSMLKGTCDTVQPIEVKISERSAVRCFLYGGAES